MLPFTIVIADDHAAVRKGLRLLMECEPSLKLIGEASDGETAIRLVHALKPDLLLMDIKMPGITGLEVLQYLRNEKNPLAIILLSCHDDFLYVEAATRLGANAFVTKAAGFEVLMNAIQAAQMEAFREAPMAAPAPVPVAAPVVVSRALRLLPC